MIVLDTNVISEMMRASPDIRVINWLDEQESNLLFITTITITEIVYGISCLPNGVRKNNVNKAFSKIINEGFKYRLLYFDESSAYECGKIMGHKKSLGKIMNFQDGQIAGIVAAQGAALATRNIKDFQHCDLELINPFVYS